MKKFISSFISLFIEIINLILNPIWIANKSDKAANNLNKMLSRK